MYSTENITDQRYWEGYYGGSNVAKEQIISICSAYDKYFDLLFSAPANKPTEVIEIGGYPGRYLAYLASKYNVRPCCLDFNSDTAKLKEAFDSMNVAEYDVIQCDFENYNVEKKYGVLFSHGFVEHFKNFPKILDKHAELVEEGGTMMITVPNMRGLKYLYAYLLDYKNLKIHNTKCMRRKVFMDFIKRNQLELLEFSYYGGFSYGVHQKLNIPQKVVYKITRLIFKSLNPILSKYPNKYTGSSIICIARKPMRNNSN